MTTTIDPVNDLASVLDLRDWMDEAICNETDPDLFFPEKGGSTREAKRICRRCAVRVQCLAYALDRDDHFGIWGGHSDRERRRMKRRAA